MKRYFPLLLIFSPYFIASCNNAEIGKASDVNPESVYFDYRIWGEEGNENITVKLQYRFAGKNGTTLLLEEPSRVELDGETLKADSSNITGVYYEAEKPVASFSGRHTITFTSSNNKQYKEEFSFQPLLLETPPAVAIHRGKLIFKFKGLDSESHIGVLLTDTSFSGEGINRVDTVRDGHVVIEKEDLDRLANGPVQLEFTKESETPVKNGTREGGRISVSHTVRREFILKN